MIKSFQYLIIVIVLIIIFWLLSKIFKNKLEYFVTDPVGNVELEAQQMEFDIDSVRHICSKCLQEEGPIGDIGPIGPSAYEHAKFPQNQEEWINQLKGPRGHIGLRGHKGITGITGQVGKSAYNVAYEEEGNSPEQFKDKAQWYQNNNRGEWVESLEGPQGFTGDRGDYMPKGSVTPYNLTFEYDNITADIPDGWALCDGNTYYIDDSGNTRIAEENTPSEKKRKTPDLRGKMVLGAHNEPQEMISSEGNPITTPLKINSGEGFGEAVVALNENNLPTHNHGGVTSTNGSHSHTVANDLMRHAHYDPILRQSDYEEWCEARGLNNCILPENGPIIGKSSTDIYLDYKSRRGKYFYMSQSGVWGGPSQSFLYSSCLPSACTAGSGWGDHEKKVISPDRLDLGTSVNQDGTGDLSHSHSISDDGEHTHTIPSYPRNQATAPISNPVHNNMPPYFALVYIMKL